MNGSFDALSCAIVPFSSSSRRSLSSSSSGAPYQASSVLSINASSIFAPFLASSSVASHGRSASGSCERAHEREPEARAIERAVVALRELPSGRRARALRSRSWKPGLRSASFLARSSAQRVSDIAVASSASRRTRRPRSKSTRAVRRTASRASASSLSIAVLYCSCRAARPTPSPCLSSASFCCTRSGFFCEALRGCPAYFSSAFCDALLRDAGLDRGLAAVLRGAPRRARSAPRGTSMQVRVGPLDVVVDSRRGLGALGASRDSR